MREIVLDTETTGLDPADGHRIVEIACLELENYVPTGRSYRVLVHPERDIPEDALRVHGISLEALTDAPAFADIADDFLAFIGDAPLVIHNAEFDLKFLNAELALAGRAAIPAARGIDTIAIAKRRFPGARYSLDELCRRFGIDLAVREKHGALIDAELLAQVYLELIGGRQTRLHLAPGDAARVGVAVVRTARPRPIPLPDLIGAAEREAHARFVAAELGGDAIWRWAA
jgi:DNA polymerase III subunit epsilon